MKRSKRVTGQRALDWWSMGESYVMAASQLVWQTEDTTHENASMYSKVSGLKINGDFWRTYSTGSLLILSALATECALKAISIQATKDGSCLKSHDLRILWDDVEGFKGKVCNSLFFLRVRALELGFKKISLIPPADVIIDEHRYTFEKGRYYNEKGRHLDITHSIDLWQLALATSVTAREICTVQESPSWTTPVLVGRPRS